MSNDLFPKDIRASQYYTHVNCVHSYYQAYRFLEKWLADNVFRGDPTRVFLASDGYAYRRRFELTDMSQDFETLDFSSLRLPFANYWPLNSGWTPDDRYAAKSAAMTYLGVYVGNTKVKAAASTLSVSTTFYFDREDDARLAYDALYFKSFNEHYYTSEVPYGLIPIKNGFSQDTLVLPMNLTVADLQFNPQTTEKDWLSKQRVFFIKAKFNIRTFVVAPPEQPDYTETVGDDGLLPDGTMYGGGLDYYDIVDDVILNFTGPDRAVKSYDAGYDPATGGFSGITPFPEEGEPNVLYIDTCPASGSVPVCYVWDAPSGAYARPESDPHSMSVRASGRYDEGLLGLDVFDYITKVGKDKNAISWKFGPDTMAKSIYDGLLEKTEAWSPETAYSKGDYIAKDGRLYAASVPNQGLFQDSDWTEVASLVDRMELHIANLPEVAAIDPSVGSYVLKGLSPNTAYAGYMAFYMVDGRVERMPVRFVTAKPKSSSANAGLDSLKGLSW